MILAYNYSRRPLNQKGSASLKACLSDWVVAWIYSIDRMECTKNVFLGIAKPLGRTAHYRSIFWCTTLALYYSTIPQVGFSIYPQETISLDSTTKAVRRGEGFLVYCLVRTNYYKLIKKWNKWDLSPIKYTNPAR